MLSTVPSQLSSTPLQTSARGAPAVTLQVVVAPALHTVVPVRWHAPTPTVQLVPVRRHVPPQFENPGAHVHVPIPLQIPPPMDEQLVPYAALPVSAQSGPIPPEQYCTPTAHSRGTHAAAGMSSVTPLQLSSTPLHTSALGAPGTALQATAPATHWVTPVR